jgi:hypothetical protein
MAKLKAALKEILEWLHHAYWIREFLLTSGLWTAAVTWAVQHAYIAAEYKWPLILVLIGLSMYVLRLAFGGSEDKKKDPNQIQAAAAALVINPQESGLSAGVDIKEFFRTAYRTTAEAEVRKNFYILARQEQPNEPEKFYLDFIGVGFLAAVFDSFWWRMFRSQLLALLEINRNSGRLPLAKVRDFYDAAAKAYPTEYADDTFERWFSYLTQNGLVIHHPSEMVEITVRGKEFLKYLAHWGREPKDKRL